jgi:glycosyltransferase involved in cell wall biosynthesis
MEEKFTKIYENHIWNNNDNGGIGKGSEIEYNADYYVPFFKYFVVNNNIKNIVDLGCGDFIFANLIYDDLDISYTGYDTYKKIIEYNSLHLFPPKYSFIHLDFFTYKENIVNGELCILKDVLQYWSLDEIYTFLDYLVENKKFKYILICNCCHQTKNDTIIEKCQIGPLSCEHLPLKKYNPVKLLNYNDKEVSVIEIKTD